MRICAVKLGDCKRCGNIISITEVHKTESQDLIFHSCSACDFRGVMIDPYSCPEFDSERPDISVIESNDFLASCVGFELKMI